MSAGIHTTYHAEIIRYVTDKTKITDDYALRHAQLLQLTYDKLDSIVPDAEEFFFIMQYALRQDNLIGVSSKKVHNLLFIFLR